MRSHYGAPRRHSRSRLCHDLIQHVKGDNMDRFEATYVKVRGHNVCLLYVPTPQFVKAYNAQRGMLEVIGGVMPMAFANAAFILMDQGLVRWGEDGTLEQV